MMYKFMTLEDGSEIVHSEFLANQKVKVYIEKPDEKDCFHYMTCYLPDYEVCDVYGFSDAEVANYVEFIKSMSHLLMEFAKGGGFENASGF